MALVVSLAYLADLVEGEELVAGGDVQAVSGLGLLQSLQHHTSSIQNCLLQTNPLFRISTSSRFSVPNILMNSASFASMCLSLQRQICTMEEGSPGGRWRGLSGIPPRPTTSRASHGHPAPEAWTDASCNRKIDIHYIMLAQQGS